MDIDYGKSASDYGKYRRPYPSRLFEKLLSFDIGMKGQTLLDLGCGTGNLGRPFARQGSIVTGLDRSESLIEEARRMDAPENLKTRYVVASSEKLPFEDQSFDTVTAGQCWHWFDREKTADETHRVLKSQGQILIAHYDWVPLPGNAVEMTEYLLLKHNPHWGLVGGTGLYPQWLRDLDRAYFGDLETFSFDTTELFTHEDWLGRMRSCGGVAPTMTKDQLQAFESELLSGLKQAFPVEPVPMRHRVYAVVGRKKGNCELWRI